MCRNRKELRKENEQQHWYVDMQQGIYNYSMKIRVYEPGKVDIKRPTYWQILLLSVT